MTERSRPRPRWGMRALVAGLLALAGIAALLTAARGASLLVPLVFTGTTTSFLLVGALITERRRGNVLGPLMLALGVLLVVYLVLDVVVRSGEPLPDVVVVTAAAVVTVTDGGWFFLIAMLFLVFPTGRIPSPRWRILVAIAAVAAVTTFLLEALRPGPSSYYTWIESPVPDLGLDIVDWWPVPYVISVLCVVAAALSLVGRWRGGGPLERAQLKWVAAAASLVGISMLGYGAGAGPGKYSETGDLGVGITLTLFPVAIGIAVLRYRLYEIDRIISRTVGWALVTVVLVAVFAIGVVGLQAALSGFTQGQTLAVAASTLIAFALFQPVRRRIQHAVDHRFDRARYDAERIARAFADRLRDETDIAAVTGDLAATVEASMRPSVAGLWLR